MSKKVGLDFGTGNSLLAVFNETLGRAETFEIPGITLKLAYRLTAAGPDHVVHVVPSLIHYSPTEILIGNQVLSRGLAEHKHTFRWMKRSIAQGNTRKKKTDQGHKSAAEAGEDFLRLLLGYASNVVSFEEDEFTFTAPTEAFEHFQDWLRRVAESLHVQRVRILDEPTACVFGYHGVARKDEVFAVYDHGCGTLDVSVVRIDASAVADRKAIQLGQAGCDEGVGGMDIDRWIADDFVRRHSIPSQDYLDLEALILRRAEETKIALSDPTQDEAVMQVPNDRGPVVRMLRTTYRRSCRQCDPRQAAPRTDDESCLGCLLATHDFHRRTAETMDRALENAAVKAGVRKSDVTKLLVTGGTSLVPAVARMLHERFNGQVEFQSPFDAVGRGACRWDVSPFLQHDYAIKGWKPDKQQFEFLPLFSIGTEYPTSKDKVRVKLRGTSDVQIRLGLEIFEVSRMKRRRLDQAMVDASGALREEVAVASDFQHRSLNPGEKTLFVIADPPYVKAKDRDGKERDADRFPCAFWVDGQRRLLVTVVDRFYGAPEWLAQHPEWSPYGGKPLLINHPVVRL